MKNKIVDLRSDTVTKPSPGMLKAMVEAELGDDVFGDDPTVNQLQREVAELLGKEAALFVPSGTMANQIALMTHTSPGDEVYCDANCHIRNYEGGAPAIIAGVMLNAMDGEHGAYTATELESRIRPNDSHFSPSRLVWVENSCNRAGGTISPQEEIVHLREVANKNDMAMHLDGARIWNVAAATGTALDVLTAPFDSVSVCLSKGLGCPVGSLTVGSQDYIDQAHRARKRLGGGMRQAGVLAGAGIYALEHNRSRMVEDHRIGLKLADTISECSAFEIDLDTVQTNIIIFGTSPGGISGQSVVDKLASENILSYAFGDFVRLVVHLNVDEAGIDRAIDVLRRHYQ
jgi:threonine aldolase